MITSNPVEDNLTKQSKWFLEYLISIFLDDNSALKFSFNIGFVSVVLASFFSKYSVSWFSSFLFEMIHRSFLRIDTLPLTIPIACVIDADNALEDKDVLMLITE